jgi:hypothetical protein
MLSKLFAYIGVHPEAVQATVQAFVRSFWYTLTGVLSGMLLLMLAQGAFNSFDDTLTWLAKYGWPFIVARTCCGEFAFAWCECRARRWTY